MISILFYYMFRLYISAITDLSAYCSFCEPVCLHNNGWYRQPKHLVELNKNTFYKSCSESKIHSCLVQLKGTISPKIMWQYCNRCANWICGLFCISYIFVILNYARNTKFLCRANLFQLLDITLCVGYCGCCVDLFSCTYQLKQFYLRNNIKWELIT